MKLVELKKEKEFSYKENLIGLVENAAGPIGQSGPVGLSTAEIRRSIRVLDTLEQFEDGETAEFEDDDYSHLVHILEDYARFGRVHRPTIKMIDDVKVSKSKSKERISEEKE